MASQSQLLVSISSWSVVHVKGGAGSVLPSAETLTACTSQASGRPPTLSQATAKAQRGVSQASNVAVLRCT